MRRLRRLGRSPRHCGSEERLRELFGDRIEFRRLERELLEITAFEHPHDYGEHFKARYGPTIAAQANARRTEREATCSPWEPARNPPPAACPGSIMREAEVGVTGAQIDPTTVRVTATYGLRDWSGNWDDDYEGTVFFAVVGE